MNGGRLYYVPLKRLMVDLTDRHLSVEVGLYEYAKIIG